MATAEWAVDRGTTLYLVIRPRIEPSLERLRVETEYRANVESLGEELNFHVLDLRESAHISRENLRDAGHLNRGGAEKFTRILAEILAGRHSRRGEAETAD